MDKCRKIFINLVINVLKILFAALILGSSLLMISFAKGSNICTLTILALYIGTIFLIYKVIKFT